MSKNKTRVLKNPLQGANDKQRQAMTDDPSYKVGFGKPPLETRFSSTHQPARRGRRRKQPENPGAIFAEELSALVEVVEGGKRRKVPKLRVGIRQFANRVATGDPKALLAGLEILRKHRLLDPSSPASLEQQKLEAEEAKQKLRDIFDRLVQAARADEEMAKKNHE